MGCCDEKVFVSTSGEDLDWQLTDNGAGGTWKGDASSIEFNIANSVHCGGVASRQQTGTAIMNFFAEKEETIILSMEGKAESKYESFFLYIDGQPVVTVQASDTATCQVNTCNMCEVQMAEQEFALTPGQHEIRIYVDSVDGYYHSDAYFKINFKIKPNDMCASCVCLIPGIVFIFQRH